MDEVFCSSCQSQNNMNETKIRSCCQTQHKKSLINCRNQHTSPLFPFRTSHFTSGTILFIFIGLLLVSGVSSQDFDQEEGTEDVTNDVAIHSVSNNASTELDVKSGGPKIAEVSGKNKRHRVKCPKEYRKTYCLHKGRCHWIADLKEPACHCKRDWEGERCESPRISLTLEEQAHNQNVIIIAVVVSFVVAVALTMVFCICWRRMKSVRKELELKEMEKEEQLLDSSETEKKNSIIVLNQ